MYVLTCFITSTLLRENPRQQIFHFLVVGSWHTGARFQQGDFRAGSFLHRTAQAGVPGHFPGGLSRRRGRRVGSQMCRAGPTRHLPPPKPNLACFQSAVRATTARVYSLHIYEGLSHVNIFHL